METEMVLLDRMPGHTTITRGNGFWEWTVELDRSPHGPSECGMTATLLGAAFGSWRSRRRIGR